MTKTTIKKIGMKRWKTGRQITWKDINNYRINLRTQPNEVVEVTGSKDDVDRFMKKFIEPVNNGFGPSKGINNTIKTKHAIKRMQRRGINHIQVELLEKYGVKKRQKQHWRKKNSQAAIVHLNTNGKKLANEKGLNSKVVGVQNLQTGAWITFYVPSNNKRIRNY